MRIDDYEYVCEGCGCIYDVGNLIFIEVEKDLHAVMDEYDLLFEEAIIEESNSAISKLTSCINVKELLGTVPTMVTYKCPICKCTVCMPDRRSPSRV